MIGLLLYRNRAIANVFSQSLGMAIRVMIFTVLGIGALRYAFPDMTSLCLSYGWVVLALFSLLLERVVSNSILLSQFVRITYLSQFALLTSKPVPPAAALTFGTQMVRQYAYFKIFQIP